MTTPSSKMSLPPSPKGMVLVCTLCRWRPRLDQPMTVVEDHFATEPDHPADIQLELVAWCFRCQAEMPIVHTRTDRSGRLRHLHSCPVCRRSKTITQVPS